mmetsp:Transcript_42066/g.51010  ORF Transcript_42066/g.51010 Transcript_42066/m.51010 type:complete len:142 (+) Transcript_42066:124-549(+)|eukprot:CAMPEP_0197861920 /NCGR_PEP_ID=MMETSP1438-20131217/38271_1 /TAXON_ID=1461541 /ORGANISM="Pterosperma sp., Strain CCMP1384" /LENGTH=141 /DNA_ID=CAMNT_0043479271 /DNA_START=116 /DNA_END=541 /DNA_ORIENTATION=+
MYMGGGQDFQDVVFRKKTPSGSATKKPAAVNQARRSGAQVETLKKFAAGGNSQRSAGQNVALIDEMTEALAHERVSTDLKKLIIQGRAGKKMTQAQLAQAINEKPQIVQEYEQGKAIPNNQVLGKMERALGVKLRGKRSSL